jgi:Rel/ankyrin family protein
LNERGGIQSAIQPVVSDVIYDKKTVAELQICELSDCTSPVAGGKKIVLLCEKVNKDDIKVRFYQENHYGQTLWEDFGDFQPNRVHKKFAISFTTPPYGNLELLNTADVFIQLYRPSDGAVSDSLPFQYIG